MIDLKNRVVMTNYDTARTFASFLPALGGEWGIPMWAFFVNRGQGLSSYGTDNKDAPMMEFETASKAYETTDITGFRTFLKVSEKPRCSCQVPCTHRCLIDRDLSSSGDPGGRRDFRSRAVQHLPGCRGRRA